jgi:hypothetical protein
MYFDIFIVLIRYIILRLYCKTHAAIVTVTVEFNN